MENLLEKVCFSFVCVYDITREEKWCDMCFRLASFSFSYTHHISWCISSSVRGEVFLSLGKKLKNIFSLSVARKGVFQCTESLFVEFMDFISFE